MRACVLQVGGEPGIARGRCATALGLSVVEDLGRIAARIAGHELVVLGLGRKLDLRTRVESAAGQTRIGVGDLFPAAAVAVDGLGQIP